MQAYGHDPQPGVVLEQARLARRPQAQPVREKRSPVMVTAGLMHGAVGVTFLARDVEVRDGMPYFCNSGRYQVVEGDPTGDGTKIPSGTPVHVEVKTVPRDGRFSALLQVTRNNGRVDFELTEWRHNRRRERAVSSWRPVTGATQVDATA